MNTENYKMKIYHGPTNIVGIAGYLSNWQRNKGYCSESIVFNNTGTRHNADVNLHFKSYSRLKIHLLRIKFFIYAIKKYELFHFYSAKTLLPYNLDLPLLRLLKKKIVMTYCGSECRLVYVDKKRNPYHQYLKIGINDPKYDFQKKCMMFWQKIWVHRFTAARDLYDYAAEVIPKNKIIKDIWLNNIFGEKLPVINEVKTNKIPIIVHAPSEHGIKGTKYVRATIMKLQKRNLKFKYKEINNLPNDKAQKIFKESDIIIDQMLLGTVGTLAFEAMAFGKPLVSYICKQTLARDIPGCPVWNANIDNLDDKLEKLIIDKKLRIKLGLEGILYAKKVLDFEKIQKEIIDMYKNID